MNTDQLRAWHDLVEILPAESRTALTRSLVEVAALSVAAGRKGAFAKDPTLAGALRDLLADLLAGEDAAQKLGLPPLGNVHILT